MGIHTYGSGSLYCNAAEIMKSTIKKILSAFMKTYFAVFGGMGERLPGGPEALAPCLVIRQITPVPGTGTGNGPAPPTSNPITPISTMYKTSPFEENLASTGRRGPGVVPFSISSIEDLLLKNGSACFVVGSIRTTM